MHKINVTPKRRNGAHFITHAPHCAGVIKASIVLKSTYLLIKRPQLILRLKFSKLQPNVRN